MEEMFPAHVLEIMADVERISDAEERECFLKLTKPTDNAYLPDYKKMWRSVERHSLKAYGIDAHDDNLWMHAFLEAATHASSLPPYYYLSAKERKELADKIDRLTKDLIKLNRHNKFDAHIVAIDGKIFNGFYIFEDFSYHNREGIKEHGNNMVLFSELLQSGAERSRKLIAEAEHSGKAAKNVRAIRFARILNEHNLRLYRKPLHDVIARAAFALYGIEYSESDICNLMNR